MIIPHIIGSFHFMFPTKTQLDKMDSAGVDKTILFCSSPHPEKADNLSNKVKRQNQC